MRPRALAPYALVAVLIAVGSSVAVLSTARQAAPAPAAGASAPPSASAARAAPELSKSSRLAYWRDGRLWVSNLDGSLRYAITAVDDLRRVSLTRWAVDGSAVAFTDSRLSLVVVTTAGDRLDVDLPPDLRSAGYRVADLRWSPDARRIAATLLRPTDGRSDAFLVDVSVPRPSWTRLTALEDLFVADWISNDEFLAYTASGVIAVVGTSGSGTVRLLTGATGVSPIIGPEGRIHYLVGRLTATRDPSFPFVTASRASVWSAATDGSDVRRETTWDVSDIRLDARLPDGRYLAHRGTSNALGTVSDDVDLLPSAAGVVERVRVAPDGRTAYGFTSDKILRIDLTRLVIGPAPTGTPTSAMSVFLDTNGEADVWFPTQLSLARGGARPPATPAARYAFSLGGHVWLLEGGVASLLHAGPVLRRTPTPAPRWSPGGDRVLVIEQGGPNVASTSLVATVVERTGATTRIAQTVGAGRSFAWSPTGTEVAIAVDRRGQSGTASDAQLEIRFFDPTGRSTRSAVNASEVAWTSRGLLLLSDGSSGTQGQIRRVEGDAPARTIVTPERLLADPRANASTGITATVSGLDAPPDGAFASLRLVTQDAASSTRTFVVVVGADGAPLQYVRAEDLTDLAWSPARPLLAYTIGLRTSTERTIVVSPTGETLATQDGRFAGWTADGQWYLVGRTTGLYAYPLAGGAAVRVGPAGVPVSAAPTR